ncbi:MAG: FAD:protein FMN transferase [Saprospiraceae bacterium]|nr:FAD:protein FMN transferase [Saprospiraceae bacterium]MCF8252104.1 FAD:protein FMN transferase [Saprospiraceae bacterium]MCF8282461.1 FAD:protein FMN transferase [Bacteroidales bacterium]MCF8313747.1 FAD:protein FMN transferase [Saprospiraceae bacterium]MCF8442446.1 FAD:protein FMN transferase [Saprospiraceae bacterium]
MRTLFSLPIFFFLSQFLLAQSSDILLENPSFDGVPEKGLVYGNLPDGWYDCGFQDEPAVDLLPIPGGGSSQVTQTPLDGLTYLGMVVREDGSWQMIGQQLSRPLEAGGVYSFSVFMCRSKAYSNLRWPSMQMVNYSTPTTLRIWGGKEACNRQELLATSEVVKNSDWEEFKFTLSPSQNYTHLILEAFYDAQAKSVYNGHLLLDKASAIKVVKPAYVLTENDRHEFTQPLMGTDFRIVAYYPDSFKLFEAVEKAFSRVAVLEKVFSDYDENSEVSWLSDERKGEVSNELWEVLDYSLEVSRRSEGAFDVSVGALTKLWRKAFRQKEFPSENDIAAAKKTVGYEAIRTNQRANQVRLKKKGMRLDFGGIAKGYAVDEAMAWLKSYGIYVALVDGGGDLALGFAPPGKEGWEIEVPDQLSNGELTCQKTFLTNTAIATSGDTYRYLEHEGKRFSHIIDSRTGYGLTDRRVVTVTAATCMAADAWATAASVGISKLLTVDLKLDGIQISVLEE